MRLELKEGMQNCLIINDSYNSDLNSLHIALDFLKRQAAVKNLKRTLILSDILQSGQSSTDLYSGVAQLLNTNSVERLIGIGNEISKNSVLFGKIKSTFYESTEDFLRSNSSLDFRNEAILLKGSRSFHFEDISSKLELLSHETTLEVNLNALVYNLNVYRNHLKFSTKIMCMVKAFAYGSGSVEVARTLQHNRCDYLAVAVADEGADLRREGIRIPIVVMTLKKVVSM
jgi:alanine racemase